MDKEIIEYYSALYKSQGTFGEQVKDDVYQTAATVSKDFISLYDRNKNVINYNREFDRVTFKTMINEALNRFRVFRNKHVLDSAIDAVNSIRFIEATGAKPSMFVTFSDVASNYGRLYKLPSEIYVPERLYTYSSIFMSHEIAHALKELNYKECLNLIALSEAIPMLMELVCSYDDEELEEKQIVCDRIKMIYNSSMHYRSDYDNMINNLNTPLANVYKAMLHENVTYLNSMYYTMVLYGLYLKNPDLVLFYVGKVLLGEITTKELLEYVEHSYDLSILYSNGFNEFEGKLKR